MSGFYGTPPRELPLVAGLRARGLLPIVERHAAEHHVTVDDIVGERRHLHIARARHAVWRELRALGWSFPEISRLFGRDHSTVMSACRGVVKAMPVNPWDVLAKLRVV